MMIILAVNIDKFCLIFFRSEKKWMKRAISKKYMNWF